MCYNYTTASSQWDAWHWNSIDQIYSDLILNWVADQYQQKNWVKQLVFTAKVRTGLSVA
jgi:hypothetical protein